MGEIFIGRILPFVTLVLFAGGMAYRLYTWKKLPSPKMTLFPAPKRGAAQLTGVLKETFFFSSLFKADKYLWFLGWIFHAMLALVFIGHFRVISWLPDRMLMGLGLDQAGIDTMSSTMGGAAGIVMLLTAIFILGRRFMIPRVKQISGNGDYFAMILILLILITGDAMRFISHFDLAETREYFHGLVTFSAATVPSNPWFLAHYLLGQILIMYMPFSKLLHFGGIFFTETLIQRQ